MLVCGDPDAPETYFAGYDKTKVSPISCPDNVAFDALGNPWIATHGNVLGSHDDAPQAGRRGARPPHGVTYAVRPGSAGRHTSVVTRVGASSRAQEVSRKDFQPVPSLR